MAAFPDLTGSRLHREIRDLGYAGGYTMVKDFLRAVRPSAPASFEVRFETPPGRQAQVDFAQVRENGRPSRAMCLGLVQGS